MNSLSWFLYAADTLANIKMLCLILLVASGLAWGLLNAAVPVSEFEVLEWPHYQKWWTRGVVAIILSAFAVAIIPSRNTMYAIAASEVGEKIATSDKAQALANEAYDGLRAWLKRQTEEAGGKTSN